MKSERSVFPKRDPNAAFDEPRSGLITLANDEPIRLAIAGDWGTGNASSARIAQQIEKCRPHYTIHLGDVYYSGLPNEVTNKFVNPWPAGTHGSFALNSNHEMYSGGAGYFGVTLQASKFARQGGLSYFSLENSNWAVVGLDSAYHSSTAFYHTGKLDDDQVQFLRDRGRRAFEDGKRLVVLTHHNAMDFSGVPVEPLWSQVTGALDLQGSCYWIWGHEHAAYFYSDVLKECSNNGRLLVKARCIGNGGVPFEPRPASPALEWAESRTFDADREFPGRATNGFLLITLRGAEITEEVFGEDGERSYPVG